MHGLRLWYVGPWLLPSTTLHTSHCSSKYPTTIHADSRSNAAAQLGPHRALMPHAACDFKLCLGPPNCLTGPFLRCSPLAEGSPLQRAEVGDMVP